MLQLLDVNFRPWLRGDDHRAHAQTTYRVVHRRAGRARTASLHQPNRRCQQQPRKNTQMIHALFDGAEKDVFSASFLSFESGKPFLYETTMSELSWIRGPIGLVNVAMAATAEKPALRDATGRVRPAFVMVMLVSFLAATDMSPLTAQEIDQATVDQWSAPYRHWHYWPDHVVPSRPKIGDVTNLLGTDVPTVYQIAGDPKWYMSFVGFDGKGYQSFVAESEDLLHWKNYRLAMGFGPTNEFDHGGCVIGAFLYESCEIKAPRLLKKHAGKYWTLYGAYPRQGGYELSPGSEGVASSQDGLAWQRAKPEPIQSVFDSDCGEWEKDCIYQPWLVQHQGRFFNFYNAAHGHVEQTGLAFSTDLLNWMRYPANPILRNRKGGYDEQFCSDV